MTNRAASPGSRQPRVPELIEKLAERVFRGDPEGLKVKTVARARHHRSVPRQPTGSAGEPSA